MSGAEALVHRIDVDGPAQPLLQVQSLVKHFNIGGGLFGSRSVVRAVDDVSITVEKGEVVGLVGESGCGKTTTARLIVGLMPYDNGRILFDGEALGSSLSTRDLRRRVQMVFQDSYASLNPRLTVEDTIAFGPRVHGISADAARERAHELLRKVGLDPAVFAARYPHELSGGQKQRVNIARALALSPQLVILDEAVSALDKSIEAQVLNLLIDLKNDLGLTYIFISHDLNVIRFISDRIVVMYLGVVVESGLVDSLWEKPRHPYTEALFAAMPSLDPDRRTQQAPIAGDPPNPINPPPGCRFHTRCAFAETVCSAKVPPLSPAGPEHHVAACHMVDPNSGHSLAGSRGPSYG